MDDLTHLALAAQRGDDGALTQLIRRTQPDVWRVSAQLAGKARAEELTQETFLRAWRALPTYRAESSVRTWLLAIARHVAVDAIRAAARRPVAAAPLVDGMGVPAPDHAEAVAAGDLIGSLTEDHRLALFLTQVIGMSYAEAADVCEVPVGTIRSRVARARAELIAQVRAAEAQ